MNSFISELRTFYSENTKTNVQRFVVIVLPAFVIVSCFAGVKTSAAAILAPCSIGYLAAINDKLGNQKKLDTKFEEIVDKIIDKIDATASIQVEITDSDETVKNAENLDTTFLDFNKKVQEDE